MTLDPASGEVARKHCYLCHASSFKPRVGEVRDAPHLSILECQVCGLVTLSSHEHISTGHYENSGMHGNAPRDIDVLLRETDADDERRFALLRASLPNKKLLDFGCGNAGFLGRAEQLAASVTGVEVESRVPEYWGDRLKILPELPTSLDVESSGGPFDIITAFHVIEHLKDPRNTLLQMKDLLSPGGRIIIEVPSSDDALLTLYESAAFQRFTYWSQHLFLFNSHTLGMLARQAELSVVAITQFQRYPLSNHLYWLSRGLPGGHQRWHFLDSPDLREAYANTLAAVGKSDTLIAYLEADQPVRGR